MPITLHKMHDAYIYAICLELQSKVAGSKAIEIIEGHDMTVFARDYAQLSERLQGVLRVSSSSVVNSLIDTEILLRKRNGISQCERIECALNQAGNPIIQLTGASSEFDRESMNQSEPKGFKNTLRRFWTGLSYPADDGVSIHKTSCIAILSRSEDEVSKLAQKYSWRGFSHHVLEFLNAEQGVLGRVNLLSKFSLHTAG